MKRLLQSSVMLLLYSFLYIPIGILILNSFNESRLGFHWAGFTTQWYQDLLENTDLLEAAYNSLVVAISSASVATCIGTLAAVALFRYNFRGKYLVNGMLFIVMMSPDIIMAISLLTLFVILGIQLGFWSLLIRTPHFACHL